MRVLLQTEKNVEWRGGETDLHKYTINQNLLAWASEGFFLGGPIVDFSMLSSRGEQC